MCIRDRSIANNVQYAVFNPALGYLTQSDTYAECGSDLVPVSYTHLVESSATCVVRNTRRRSTMVMTSMSELLMYSIALK